MLQYGKDVSELKRDLRTAYKTNISTLYREAAASYSRKFSVSHQSENLNSVIIMSGKHVNPIHGNKSEYCVKDTSDCYTRGISEYYKRELPLWGVQSPINKTQSSRSGSQWTMVECLRRQIPLKFKLDLPRHAQPTQYHVFPLGSGMDLILAHGFKYWSGTGLESPTNTDFYWHCTELCQESKGIPRGPPTIMQASQAKAGT